MQYHSSLIDLGQLDDHLDSRIQVDANWKNEWKIGIAATYCELDGVASDLAALLLSTSPNGRRSKLTVHEPMVLSIIDQNQLDTDFMLHWLRVLVNSVPKLSKWKGHVKLLFL